MRHPPLLSISGPIGAGKTTLARRLAEVTGSHFEKEVYAENPFLPRLYAPGGVETYGLACEMAFLGPRFDQAVRMDEARAAGRSVVTDWTIFQCLLFAELTITDPDDHAAYERVFTRLARQVQPPDLLVILDAENDVIEGRVARRARALETENVDPALSAYRARVIEAYRRWHGAPPVPVPTLVLNTTALNVVDSPADMATALDRIWTALPMDVRAALPQWESGTTLVDPHATVPRPRRPRTRA